jgi:hypothetical protein
LVGLNNVTAYGNKAKFPPESIGLKLASTIPIYKVAAIQFRVRIIGQLVQITFGGQ